MAQNDHGPSLERRDTQSVSAGTRPPRVRLLVTEQDVADATERARAEHQRVDEHRRRRAERDARVAEDVRRHGRGVVAWRDVLDAARPALRPVRPR